MTGNNHHLQNQSQQVEDEIFHKIVEFVNAPNWNESRKVLSSTPLLMSPQADSAFKAMIQKQLAQGDVRTAYHLAIHRDLIRNCRELGYKEAFRLVSEPPSEETVRAVRAFVEAGDMDATRAAIEQHPALLTPEAEATLQAMIQTALDGEDDRQVQALAAHHDLLRACREMGIETAFEQLSQPQEDAEANLLLTLAAIGQNTIAVLTNHPEMHDEWLSTVEQVQADAAQRDDIQLERLADAVYDLLVGTPIEEITVSLNEPYASVWEQISLALRAEE